jgi:hypothetical protein
MDEDKFAQILEERVHENWIERKSPFLLSALGAKLRKEGIEIRSILKTETLSAFIGRKLKGRIELFAPPGQPVRICAFPHGELLEQSAVTSTNLGKEIDLVSLHKTIWAAFSYPIPSGKRRKVLVSPEIAFQDVETAQWVQGDLEVPPQAVVPQGTGDPRTRGIRVRENILRWADENKVSRDDIVFQKPTRLHPISGRTPLNDLLMVLSDQELARISMPLDLVKKLMKHKA